MFLCQTDVPNADSFESVLKKGNLLKLIGKGWLFPGTWKQRFCVLQGNMLYYYENENGKGSEKATGFINMETYEVCEEVDDKKYPFAFHIGMSTKGFFDNRHYFAAQEKSGMQEWIRSVQDVLASTRISKNCLGKPRVEIHASQTIGGKNDEIYDEIAGDDQDDDEAVTQRLVSATKDRVRGPQGRKLPNRISCVPKEVPTNEDDRKQKSVSAYSPVSESPEDDQSDENRKRISCSMEEMTRELLDHTSELNGQKCISSDDITTRSNNDNASNTNLARRAGFGKLGTQQAALAKELELKFKKTSLPPGGLRFPKLSKKEHSTTRQTPDTETLELMIESLDNRVHTLLNSVDEILEPKIEEVKSNAKNSTVDWSQLTKAKDLLKQSSTTLKEAEVINAESKQVLEHAKKLKADYQKLLKEFEEKSHDSTTIQTSEA